MPEKKESIINRISDQIKKVIHFLQVGIWRTEDGITKFRQLLYSIVKSFMLAIRRYNEDQLQNRASALTYNTLLSIVPMLAVLFAIARGFGFQNIIQSQLFNFLPGQREALVQSFVFVDSYLEQAKSGVFVGVEIGRASCRERV